MNEYIKLQIPFRERLLLFFTGLINKKYIISISKKPKQVITKESVEAEAVGPEFEMEIPFFELDNGDTKSNL